MFPEVLLRMAQKLAADGIVIEQVTNDGRVNSGLGEADVIKYLQANFDNVDSSEARNWWDIAVTDDKGNWYPVNIKISKTDGSDNLSSKEGLFYALTGIDPTEEKFSINSWGNYFKNLKKYLNHDETKDYYFLVVDKRPDPEEPMAWIASLKTLNTLVPNGNNLPFQCRWSENKIPHGRNTKEATEFLLSHLAKSIKLRAQILDEFKQYFPEQT